MKAPVDRPAEPAAATPEPKDGAAVAPLATALAAATRPGAVAGVSRASAVLQLQRSHGNAAVGRMLMRRAPAAPAAPEAERVVDLPAGTEIYNTPKKQGKPDGATEFRQPVGLIGLTNVELAPGLIQGYWAVSMGGRQVYVKQEALADSVAATLEEWRGKDDDPTLGNRPGGRLRHFVLEELEPFIKAGKVLERTEMFRRIVSDEDLATARASHQTTCILFQGRILTNAAAKLNAERGVKVALDKNKLPVTEGGYMGVVNVSVKGTQAKSRASLIGHGMQRKPDETGRFAWWEASVGMPKGRRPRKGDIYVLHMKDNRSKFSHVGFFIGHEDNGDHEIWHTMDGGQGVSKQQQEAFEVRHRKYIPGKNLLEGEPNQDAEYRWVLGWVDVDQLEKSPTPKADAQSAAFVGIT